MGYAIELPEASRATMDDQSKSQMAWRLLAGGWCCFLLGYMAIWRAAFTGSFSSWGGGILEIGGGLMCCGGGWIFYCQIPASQRSDYTKTKTPAVLGLSSFALCCCCATLGITIAMTLHHVA